MQLKLTRASNAEAWDVPINSIIEIDPEEYLLGCVPSEMNGPDEAVKAQAIAARTNAYANKLMTDDSTKHQAYRHERAIDNAYAKTHACVEATAGLVLTYNGKLCNTAPFSSSNGGQIKSSQEVWGGVRGWLVSKPDPYTTEKRNGHCVGMSQLGAKRMANQGFSYLNILQFYYPGTEVKEVSSLMTTAEKEKKIRDYAISKAEDKCGYVWGAQGQILTQSRLDAWVAQYPDHVDPSIVKKWMGKQVFDCQGFTKLCFAQVNIKLVSGASSQWKSSIWVRKGPISEMPKDKVCALYHESPTSNPMSHTGVYLGDGTFIHSAGSKTGVKRQKLGEYKWTHYAIPAGLYTQAELDGITPPEEEVFQVLYQATVKASSGSTVRMRSGAGTNYGALANVPIGTVVDVVEHGAEWDRIIYKGQNGYMMNKFLDKIESSEPSTGGAWYIKVACDSEAEAKEIVTVLQKLAQKAQATT